METTAATIFSDVSEMQAAEKTLPTATHQGTVGCLFTEISVYLKAREQCRIMAAPFAIFLKNPLEVCLQPDISVIQDAEKLDDEGCHGAPDWVIEVVSPFSRHADYGQKLGIYINAGVREYWIVDPEKKLIVAYCLEHPDVPAIYRFGDIIKSDIYPDLVIDSSLLDRIQYRKAVENRDTADEAGNTVGNSIAGEPEYSDPQPASQSLPTGTSEETPPEPITDPAAIKAFLLEHFPDLAAAGSKGALLKAAMGTLKGRADSRAVNEVVAELCQQNIHSRTGE